MNYLETLKHARLELHKAVQWPSRAARANLPPSEDDSHSSLVWHPELQLLVSQNLISDGNRLSIGVSFWPFQLEVLSNGKRVAHFELSKVAERDVGSWLDGQLHTLGLQSASPCAVPYELPDIPVGGHSRHDNESIRNAFQRFRDMFQNAALIITDTTAKLGGNFDASPLRCWPHHFDIATLLAVDDNDKSIGVGFSPGDEIYNYPYYYVTPWPYPNINSVSPLTYGDWHNDGYFAGVLSLDKDEIDNRVVRSFLEEAFKQSHDALCA